MEERRAQRRDFYSFIFAAAAVEGLMCLNGEITRWMSILPRSVVWENLYRRPHFF